IEYLTDWAELSLIVHHRALSTDATLDDQLRAAEEARIYEDAQRAKAGGVIVPAGIQPGTDRVSARVKIVQSLTPPSELQTAIELPFRLLLSPDAGGKFETP